MGSHRKTNLLEHEMLKGSHSLLLTIAIIWLAVQGEVHGQNPRWGTLVESTSISGTHCVTTDPLGNVITIGGGDGTLDLDPGPGLATFNCPIGCSFVQKLDSSGNLIWAKALMPSSGWTILQAVEADALGNLFIAGNIVGYSDVDPGPGVVSVGAPF